MGVRLPDEQAAELETMTVGECAAAFEALLHERPPVGDRTLRLPTREDVVVSVAEACGVAPAEVSEEIDSLARMWLLHSMEQRYGIPMDIPHDSMAQLGSVEGAVRVLRDVLQRTEGIELLSE